MRATFGSIDAVMAVFFAFLIFATPPAFAQSGSDALDLTVTLPKPVHFSDTQGSDVLVPANTYWVFPEEKSLMLVGLEEGNIYTLAVTTEKSAEEMPYPTATSLSGAEDEADIHYVVYTSTDGAQFVAEGSYSGVKSRGRLGDRAKKAAAAAAARARQNALVQAAKRKALENERMMEAARAAQAVIEQAKSYGQEKAMERAQFLVGDVTTTLKDHGQGPARNKLKTYTPELAVLIPIAIPPKTQLEITKQAAMFVNRNKVLILEILDRTAKSQTIKRHIGERRGLEFTPDEVKQISVDIMGRGDNALQLPFVSTRGLSKDVTGPSLSVGADVAGSFGLGGVLSGGGAISLTEGINTGAVAFAPEFCIWGGGGLTLGPKADVGGTVGVAVWQGAASDIGWTPSLEVGPEALRAQVRGFSVPVNIGFKAGPVGVSVTVYFGLGTTGRLIPTILGFGVAYAGGAGAGGSVGLVSTYALCPLRK